MSQEETNAPSREEMVQFYTDQIELKKLQVELQELNTRFIKAKAEEIQATAFIGQMMSENQEESDDQEEDNTPIQQPVDRKLKKDGDV